MNFLLRCVAFVTARIMYVMVVGSLAILVKLVVGTGVRAWLG